MNGLAIVKSRDFCVSGTVREIDEGTLMISRSVDKFFPTPKLKKVVRGELICSGNLLKSMGPNKLR